MELVEFLIVLLLSTLGLVAGLIVGNFSREEWKDGKKYFLWAQDIIILALIYFLWSANVLTLLVLWPVVLLFALMLLHPEWVSEHTKLLKGLRTGFFSWVLFGFVLFSVKESSVFQMIAILIFLYGIPEGTLALMEKGWKNKALLKGLAIILTGLVAFWLAKRVF
jgi:hypothetical protein